MADDRMTNAIAAAVAVGMKIAGAVYYSQWAVPGTYKWITPPGIDKIELWRISPENFTDETLEVEAGQTIKIVVPENGYVGLIGVDGKWIRELKLQRYGY